MKHPYLLRCIEAGEQLDGKGGGTMYIVTEPVQPLEDVLVSLQETSLIPSQYKFLTALPLLIPGRRFSFLAPLRHGARKCGGRLSSF